MEFVFSHCTLTNEVRVIENYKENDPKRIEIAMITEGPEGGIQIPFHFPAQILPKSQFPVQFLPQIPLHLKSLKSGQSESN